MTDVVRMRRNDNAVPWGFRMHGGLEYGMPLYVQKVGSQRGENMSTMLYVH